MIEKMNISQAKYIKNDITNKNSSIKATINGQESFVPLEEGNRHYDEIMRKVNAGTLTIEEAD